MIIKLNDTLVNVNNICTAKMYNKISKLDGTGQSEDHFRIYIEFIGGKSSTITFKDREIMECDFKSLEELYRKHFN